jgi:hypothetical protein
LNLDFRGGNAGPRGGVYSDHRGIGTGLCSTTNDSYWLVCNNSFSNFYLGMHLGENSGRWNNWRIWGNRFSMNDLDGILARGGTSSSIDANFFDNNGGMVHPTRGNNAHSLYINDGGPGASVVNNEFRRSGVANPSVGLCENAIAVGHGVFDGLNVENNIVDGGPVTGTSCWGFDYRAAGSQATAFRNTTIRRNWVNAVAVGISLGQAPDSTIENNVVVMPGTQPGGFRRGILSPSDAARAQDAVQNNTTIRNNTIYINGGASAYWAVLLGTEGTGHVIANNSVQSGGGSCFVTPLAAGAYAFVGNNSCYGGAAWGTAYDATTHITANPMFISPPTDFTPAAGSPLIGAGSAAHAPSWDFTVRTRPSPPSMGAYEP